MSSIKKLLTLAFLSGAAVAAPANDKRGRGSGSYDYIIVGGGTAGTALATRLSQGMPDKSILLIEAGPSAPNEPMINIPGKKGSTIGTNYDWKFASVAQANVNNRSFSVPRAKVLGGTSAMNLMSYDRASTAEYDAWEELGNPGWNWNNMIAAMEKAETFHNTGDYGSLGVGHSGPIQAVINRIVPEHQSTWIPTMEGLAGLPNNLESLGGDPIGVMKQPSNINPSNWSRSYAIDYLPLASSNLEIMTETLVKQVNLKKVGRKYTATGVTLTNGTVIPADKEVIISAGTIQSPGLLEVSGIGQSAILSAAGIAEKVALNGVGENYQDHVRIQAAYQLQPNYTSFDRLKYDSAYAAEQLQLWNEGEVSLYDYTASGFAYLNWNQTTGNNEASLLALAQAEVGSSTNPVDKKKLEYLSSPRVPQVEVIFSDGYTGSKGYPASGSALYGQNFFTLIAGIMHPLSRGSVHIQASNPYGYPAVNPNYMDKEYDLEGLKTIIKFVRSIAQSSPMNSVWVNEYEPGLDVDTDAQWEAYVKASSQSLYHPVGTCAMLPKADGGVVDPSLTVYGTSNLRVVDASIIPVLISAHIQTAVYGIAERAAEIIIGDCASEKHKN